MLALLLHTYDIPNKWLKYKYQDYTPEQIVEVYHKTFDEATICFLTRNGTTQINILELPDKGILIFEKVDSIATFHMGTYVYSTFRYSVPNHYNAKPIMTCLHIREALYYIDNVWRVGSGNIINIGCSKDKIENADYINIEV